MNGGRPKKDVDLAKLERLLKNKNLSLGSIAERMGFVRNLFYYRIKKKDYVGQLIRYVRPRGKMGGSRRKATTTNGAVNHDDTKHG